MTTEDLSYWVQKLELKPHPEGGFYKETYRSAERIPMAGLPSRFRAPRSFSTAIYFLLPAHEYSSFHRIQSDELWHFHIGGSLTLFVLNEDRLETKKLGGDPEKDEALQVTIPAGSWFAAEVTRGSFVLAGCTVSPGFDFADFELATGRNLSDQYPAHQALIARLTRS